MKGKNRCRILKDIRRRIAEENDIVYITSECKYKGDCPGTCPKCESEVRYLESELERRRSLGYKVTVAGLAAGITLASAGCTPDKTSEFSKSESLHIETSVEEGLAFMGNLIAPETGDDISAESVCIDDITIPEDDLMGVMEAPSDAVVEPTMGDIP